MSFKEIMISLVVLFLIGASLFGVSEYLYWKREAKALIAEVKEVKANANTAILKAQGVLDSVQTVSVNVMGIMENVKQVIGSLGVRVSAAEENNTKLMSQIGQLQQQLATQSAALKAASKKAKEEQ